MLKRNTCAVLVVGGLLLWVCAGLVWASGAVYSLEGPAVPAEDQILVVYDPVTKQEKITFGPVFRFRGEHLGFLIPTPAEAKIESTSSQVFLRLNDYVNPPVQPQIIRHWQMGSLIWHFIKSFGSTPPPGETPGLNPLSPEAQKLVARRMAQLRLAKAQTDTAENFLTSLQTELQNERPRDNSLNKVPPPAPPIPEEFAAWVKTHQDKKMFWNVLIARTDQVEADSKMDEQVALQPFTLTFTTDTPFIPMVLPVTESPKEWKQNHVFRYFVAMPQRAEIVMGNQPFFKPGELVFADRMPADDWRLKIFSARLEGDSTNTGSKPVTPAPPAPASPTDVFLTAFIRRDTTTPAVTEDAVIKPATAQASFRPPPKVVEQHQTVTLPIEAGLLVIGGVVAMIRGKKRTED